MDLAKIRKKHRQASAFDSIAVNSIAVDSIASIKNALPLAVPRTVTQVYSDSGVTFRDPIEVILSGRKAAGCDEKLTGDEEHTQAVAEECLEYLCFMVSDEIYGINIMDIKEIIKPREVTEIPCAPEFVSGIISLRGTIIPIIDMRSRLGLSCETPTGKERVVVIKKAESFSGLFVDEVIKVVRLNEENMEPAPSVLEGIDREFVSGIGRSEGRLIIILNLENIADIHLF